MAKRERVRLTPNNYFVDNKPSLQFISSGCTLLDCALGGGWALGRIANIVGDKSTAKTALATEAIINFLNQYPKGAAAYRETEAAYDRDYAAAMGLPVERVEFASDDKPILTVEDFARDLEQFVERQKKADAPGIYVLDSLDALSDDAEMEQDIGKGTYGATKAKQMSKLFRTRIRKVEDSKVCLIIVSQVRDNIGAMFGEKHTRSGGKALDFYASQICWLAHMKFLKKTVSKIERPIGIEIRARVKKNKVGIAHREASFPFIFGYGVEDLEASVRWLVEVNRLTMIGLKVTEAPAYIKNIPAMRNAEYVQEQIAVSKAVKEAWREIETTFLPTRQKYA